MTTNRSQEKYVRNILIHAFFLNHVSGMYIRSKKQDRPVVSYGDKEGFCLVERKRAKSHRRRINLFEVALLFRFLFLSTYSFSYRPGLKPYGILFGPSKTRTNQCLWKDFPQIRQR